MSEAPSLNPDVAAVLAARGRIAEHVRRTPLEHSAARSAAQGRPVHLKLECWQPTRSFKVRGAFSAVSRLTEAQRAAGLVTASAGNHGQAVALAAKTFGARATIFVPADAPHAKKRRIAALGARLDETAADYDEADVLATRYARDTAATFVHAFSDDDVVAGQGTVALEILEDLPDVSTIVVPVGGGGLVAGIGIVLRERAPHVRLVGVQSLETRVMHASLAAGRVVELPVTPTLADGLAGGIDARSFERVRRLIDDVILVDERAIADSIRSLYVEDGVVAEGSAATAVAALPHLGAGAGPVALVITGGNIDAAKLTRILTDS